jgi:RNA-binding protein
MDLNERQKKYLRRLGHELHPLVTLGQSGLTEGVTAELERALTDHELVKVKARTADRESRDAAFAALTEKTSSTVVQRIGHVALLYRKNPRLARIVMPD